MNFVLHLTPLSLLCHAIVAGLFLRAVLNVLRTHELRRRLHAESCRLEEWTPNHEGEWHHELGTLIHPAARIAAGRDWETRDFETPFVNFRDQASANRSVAASAGLVCTALGIAIGASHFGSTTDQADFVRAIGDAIMATVVTVIVVEIEAANLRSLDRLSQWLEGSAKTVAEGIASKRAREERIPEEATRPSAEGEATFRPAEERPDPTRSAAPATDVSAAQDSAPGVTGGSKALVLRCHILP